ncbi:MAG: hypothetical protein AAB882_00220 [Patescibacteria group bacterium]
MKNAILGFLFFTSIVFPSFSHAQFVPFGGYDMEIFPECDCTPIPILLTCTNPAPTPPTYFFHLFAPLWIGTAVPIGGFLAQLIEEPALAFPDHVLLPGTWALGELIPVVPNPLTTCGVYISFSAAAYAACEYYPEAPVGMCIPIIPAIGVITPFTGTGVGGW